MDSISNLLYEMAGIRPNPLKVTLAPAPWSHSSGRQHPVDTVLDMLRAYVLGPGVHLILTIRLCPVSLADCKQYDIEGLIRARYPGTAVSIFLAPRKAPENKRIFSFQSHASSVIKGNL